MGSIQKAKFGFSTKDRYVEFELTIKISTEFKFFYWTKELPEQLRQHVHGDRRYFDSFHELERSVNELIAAAEIEFIHETKTKVILYSIETENHHGQQIDFKWMVVQRVETSRRKQKTITYYEEQRGSHGSYVSDSLREVSTYHSFGDKDPFEMAWTIEREQWFSDMDAALAKMSHKLSIGFGNIPEVLARKIDQGAKFLLAGAGEEQAAAKPTAARKN